MKAKKNQNVREISFKAHFNNVVIKVFCTSIYTTFIIEKFLKRLFLSQRSSIGEDAGLSVVHISLISHKQFMITRVLRRMGVRAEYVAINVGENDRLNIGYDAHIQLNAKGLSRFITTALIVMRILFRYDVVHYHFTGFLGGHEGWELPLFKKAGKVIVFHFRGCEARWRSLNQKSYPEINICQSCDYPVGYCDTQAQRDRLARVQKYGDLFFATTPDILTFIPDAVHVPFIAPVLEGYWAIDAAPKNKDTFRVVTSSNHPGIDGLQYIKDAVERLQSTGENIELVEVVGLPYTEALSMYKSADLYVGKLKLGYYNNANIETMMFGVPNMSFIRDEFSYLVPDCPIIRTKPDTLFEDMRCWLGKKEELIEIGKRGPSFVKRHHDPEDICRFLIECYNIKLLNK